YASIWSSASSLRQRPPPFLRDPHLRDLDRASAAGQQPRARLLRSRVSAHEIDHLCDGEAMREHDRLGAAVARRGQQLERAAAVGLEAVAQMAKRASAESVSASMPEYTQTRVRMRRPQARRTRALVCSGVTRSEKAFVSQCVPEAPIAVTFRQKVLRYQRTAQSVLNRGSKSLSP